MQAIQAATDRNTGMVDPVLLQNYSKMLGIDLSGLVSAGQKAGQQYTGLAGQAQAGAGQLFGAGMDQFAAGRDIYNLGRDPQNQLHDSMRQQMIEGSRGADSARGIAMGGVSAGHEADAQRKFEMDWQNQQLGRAGEGLRGMTQAGYYGGMNLGRGMEMGAQVPRFTMAGAEAPIAGQHAAYQMPMDWSSQFTQAQQHNVLDPRYGIQHAALPYMQAGTQAGSAQAGAQLGNRYFGAQRQQQGLGNILGGLGGLSDIWGGASGAGGALDWGSAGAGDLASMMAFMA
jgi:hypothetical protein